MNKPDYLIELVSTLNSFRSDYNNFLCLSINPVHIDQLQEDLIERFNYTADEPMPCIITLFRGTLHQDFEGYLSRSDVINLRFALQHRFVAWAIEKHGYTPIMLGDRVEGFE